MLHRVIAIQNQVSPCLGLKPPRCISFLMDKSPQFPRPSVSCPLPTPTPSPKEVNPPENSEFAMEDLGSMGFSGENVG